MTKYIVIFILVIIVSHTSAWCDNSTCRVFNDTEIKLMNDDEIKSEIFTADKIASQNIEHGNKLVALRSKDTENEAHNCFRISYVCNEQVKKLLLTMLSRPQNIEFKPKNIEECLNKTNYAFDNTKLCKKILKLQSESPRKTK